MFFVSHSMPAVQDLCSRALWIDGGRLVHEGKAQNVAAAYTQSIWAELEQRNREASRAAVAATVESGRYAVRGDDLRITAVRLLDASGEERALFEHGTSLRLRIEWEGQTAHTRVFASFRIDSDMHYGVVVIDGSNHGFLQGGGPVRGSGAVEYEIPSLHLGQGTYFVTCSLRYLATPRSLDDYLHYLEKVAHFSVQYPGRHMAHRTVYEPPVTVRQESTAGPGAAGEAA